MSLYYGTDFRALDVDGNALDKKIIPETYTEYRSHTSLYSDIPDIVIFGDNDEREKALGQAYGIGLLSYNYAQDDIMSSCTIEYREEMRKRIRTKQQMRYEDGSVDMSNFYVLSVRSGDGRNINQWKGAYLLKYTTVLDYSEGQSAKVWQLQESFSVEEIVALERYVGAVFDMYGILLNHTDPKLLLPPGYSLPRVPNPPKSSQVSETNGRNFGGYSHDNITYRKSWFRFGDLCGYHL